MNFQSLELNFLNHKKINIADHVIVIFSFFSFRQLISIFYQLFIAYIVLSEYLQVRLLR